MQQQENRKTQLLVAQTFRYIYILGYQVDGTRIKFGRNNPLLRSLVGHSLSWFDFLCDRGVALSNLMGDFLVGLDQITAQAAPCLQKIHGKISFNVVLFSDFTLLDKLETNWEANAAGEPETQAGRVDRRVSLKGWGLAKSVMGLAKGNAWATAGDQAGINGIEASEERAGPGVWTGGWLGDSLRLVNGILESRDPGVDIIWMDSSRSCSVLLRSCHFVNKNMYVFLKE